MVAVGFEAFVNVVDIKVRIRGEDFLQDGIPLGCSPHVFGFEIGGEGHLSGVVQLFVFYSHSVCKDKDFK